MTQPIGHLDPPPLSADGQEICPLIVSLQAKLMWINKF